MSFQTLGFFLIYVYVYTRVSSLGFERIVHRLDFGVDLCASSHQNRTKFNCEEGPVRANSLHSKESKIDNQSLEKNAMGLPWEDVSALPDSAVQQLLLTVAASDLMSSKAPQPVQWASQALSTIPEIVESPYSHQALSPTSYDSQPGSPDLASPVAAAEGGGNSPTSALAANSDSEEAAAGLLDS